MQSNDMVELLEQLEREGKDLIAITDEYILVYWYQDKSYVSWKYWHTGPGGKYVFEVGNYLKIHNQGFVGNTVSKNEAIKWFAERIN